MERTDRVINELAIENVNLKIQLINAKFEAEELRNQLNALTKGVEENGNIEEPKL